MMPRLAALIRVWVSAKGKKRARFRETALAVFLPFHLVLRDSVAEDRTGPRARDLSSDRRYSGHGPRRRVEQGCQRSIAFPLHLVPVWCGGHAGVSRTPPCPLLARDRDRWWST